LFSNKASRTPALLRKPRAPGRRWTQPSKPARFDCRRRHARHGPPPAPLSTLDAAVKGRGAAGRACPRMAATPNPAPLPRKWRGTKPDADSPRPQSPRQAATRARHSKPAQTCGLYVIPACAGLHTATAAPACRAAPAWPPVTALARAGRSLPGGRNAPPRPPRPRRGRQPARHRPCEAMPAAPPAARARSDLAAARQGAATGGRGLRAWRRTAGGAPPACGGRPSRSRVSQPESAHRYGGAPGWPRVRSRTPKASQMGVRFDGRSVAIAAPQASRGAAP